MPPPVLNFHSRSPVAASWANRYPATLLPVPTNTTPPAVTTGPAWPQPSNVFCHFRSPVAGSNAENTPRAGRPEASGLSTALT